MHFPRKLKSGPGTAVFITDELFVCGSIQLLGIKFVKNCKYTNISGGEAGGDGYKSRSSIKVPASLSVTLSLSLLPSLCYPLYVTPLYVTLYMLPLYMLPSLYYPISVSITLSMLPSLCYPLLSYPLYVTLSSLLNPLITSIH